MKPYSLFSSSDDRSLLLIHNPIPLCSQQVLLFFQLFPDGYARLPSSVHTTIQRGNGGAIMYHTATFQQIIPLLAVSFILYVLPHVAIGIVGGLAGLNARLRLFVRS